jgi:ribosomal-protein-serine acetyltransferase
MVDPFPDQLDASPLRLRRLRPGDAAGLLALIERNRARLIPDFPELARGLTAPEEAAAYITARDDEWKQAAAFVYGIWTSPAALPIGQLRMKSIVWNVPSAELSYFVDEGWLRRGVATRAVRALLREAFGRRGFKRLYVRVTAANEQSLALARRLGLRHEGVHRNAFRCGRGALHDVHVFAMTDADYRSAGDRG